MGHDEHNKLVELEAKGNNKNTTQVSENVNGDKQGSSRKNRKRAEDMQRKRKKINQLSNRQGGVYTESEIKLWKDIYEKEGRKRHISTHTNTETGDVKVLERDNQGKISSTLDEFTIDDFNEKKEIIDNHFIKKGK
ncbi:hypothetical protein ACJJIQ_06280 [Microbulbifer sp. ANSA003]|uniref:hypothetical protein n=1 Tax=Microbulbifer sp. ANSA003 TaxID=3243360 RepID=UPI004042C996